MTFTFSPAVYWLGAARRLGTCSDRKITERKEKSRKQSLIASTTNYAHNQKSQKKKRKKESITIKAKNTGSIVQSALEKSVKVVYSLTKFRDRKSYLSPEEQACRAPSKARNLQEPRVLLNTRRRWTQKG